MASIKNKFIANLSMIALVASLGAPSFSYAQATSSCVVSTQDTLKSDELFDFDKYSLTPQGQKTLDTYAANLKKMKSTSSISLVGHTDGKGTADYNQVLGQNRADAVKAYLVSKGIDANLIQTSSKGKTELLNNELTADGKDDPEKRALNRRVVASSIGTVEVAGTNCPVNAAAQPTGGVAATQEASGGLSNNAIVGIAVFAAAALAIGLSGGGDSGTTGTTGTTGTISR